MLLVVSFQMFTKLNQKNYNYHNIKKNYEDLCKDLQKKVMLEVQEHNFCIDDIKRKVNKELNKDVNVSSHQCYTPLCDLTLVVQKKNRYEYLKLEEGRTLVIIIFVIEEASIFYSIMSGQDIIKVHGVQVLIVLILLKISRLHVCKILIMINDKLFEK